MPAGDCYGDTSPVPVFRVSHDTEAAQRVGRAFEAVGEAASRWRRTPSGPTVGARARGHGRALQVRGSGVRKGAKRSRKRRGKGGRGGPEAVHSGGPKVKWGSTRFVPVVRDRPYWHVYVRLGQRRYDRRKPSPCNGLPIVPGAGVEPARGVRPRGF